MPYLGNQHIVGDSVNNFKVLDDISSFTATFDGSAASVVSTANETIKVPKHRFVQGQRVTYNNGGGSNIGGLSSGTAYYVIEDTAHTIKLAANSSDAASLTAINLNDVGGGTSHTLNVAFDGVNTKFRITHGNGNRPRFHHATQLSIAINNVIQRPNDSLTFTEGYAVEIRDIIVFKTAPTVDDIFFGSLTGETRGRFDIQELVIDNFTGDGSTKVFVLSQIAPNNQSLLITLNGVIQHPTTDGVTRSYSVVSGESNQIEFITAPASGVEIQVRHLGFAGATSSAVTGFYGRTGNVGLNANDHITTGDITPRNINSSGIITATSFVGSGANLTGIDATSVKDSAGNVKIQAQASGAVYTGIHTFTGDVSIGGTLTYEDVKNLDAVGLGTFREGIFIPDSKEAKFGNTAASPDLKIYSDGTHQNIVGSAGNFTIKNTTMNATYLSGAYLNLTNAANTQTFLTANANSTKLFHGGTQKLSTTSKGITVGTGVTIETNGQATFVGVVTFGSSSTTIDGDANTVKVGTALTLGHTQGLQFHTQNLHSAGFEVNQINATGVITATSFSGSGANLTGLASREVYGFTGIGKSLSLTTTNSGADNIDNATYVAFEQSFIGPSGLSFSINTSGNLIMTV